MYRNPRRLSDKTLAQEAARMGKEARAVMRQFQRKKSSIYSSEYEGLASKNRQLYGQALLPKKPPTDRAGLEEYFRRAQRALNLDSVPETRKRILAQKAALENTLKIQIPGKFDAKAQKALSDFLHSDEWKKVYAFGSARAMEMLHDELAAGIAISDEKAAESLKAAFIDFAATEDLIITER
jgi:hypothetical protein